LSVNREPAIKRPSHPAAGLPERPTLVPDPIDTPTPPVVVPEGERLTEQHNVRIRPTTKRRLGRAVDKLRYESGDRSISIASITDEAINRYLSERGC